MSLSDFAERHLERNSGAQTGAKWLWERIGEPVGEQDPLCEGKGGVPHPRTEPGTHRFAPATPAPAAAPPQIRVSPVRWRAAARLPPNRARKHKRRPHLAGRL